MKSYRGGETTGFTSPAQDYTEQPIDLAAALELRRPGRYPVRFVDQDLCSRGIHRGDILITDAAADPKDGQVCVAIMDGERVLVTIMQRDGVWWLKRAGREPVEVGEEVEIYGAVTALVRTKV